MQNIGIEPREQCEICGNKVSPLFKLCHECVKEYRNMIEQKQWVNKVLNFALTSTELTIKE
jgi:predicted nucleic acid-binding Zn ribbon protein